MVSSNMSDANVHAVNLVGGNICLDFANTLYWRGRPDSKELLKTYADLVDWSLRVKLISPEQAVKLRHKALQDPKKAEKLRLRAIELRELIYRIFGFYLDGFGVDEDDLDRLNFEWGRRIINSKLIQDGNGFRWKMIKDESSMDMIFTAILESCIELLTLKDLRRVKKCADNDCSWLFFDKSRNMSRRWCDMKDCGNRAKVNMFYKRQASGVV